MIAGELRIVTLYLRAGRSDAELSECYRHECLLNVAFDGTDGFTLLCPYDTATLDPGVVDHASGPLLVLAGSLRLVRTKLPLARLAGLAVLLVAVLASEHLLAAGDGGVLGQWLAEGLLAALRGEAP